MNKPKRDLFTDGFTAEDFIHGSAEANSQIANQLLRAALADAQAVYGVVNSAGEVWDGDKCVDGSDTHEAKLVAKRAIKEEDV